MRCATCDRLIRSTTLGYRPIQNEGITCPDNPEGFCAPPVAESNADYAGDE